MKFLMRINDEVVALNNAQLDALYKVLEGTDVVGEEHVGKDMGTTGYQRSYIPSFADKFGTHQAPKTMMSDDAYEAARDLWFMRQAHKE
tara:strand:+ start:382 stop:648 length:267 start_codon:yes stop_codon:yes gene_type:complete